MTSKLQKSAYAALILTLLAYAANNWLTTFHELRRFYTDMWIWDPWDYLSHFAAYRRFDFSVLWIQHNEHRVIGTELAYIADIFLFHGKQIFPEAVGIAAYLAALLMMAAFVWFWSENKWAAAAATLLVASIAGYKICAVSLNIPFLNCWPQVEFFGIAALAAVALNQKRGGILLLALAIISGVAATYSLSNGMLIWPLLIAATLILRAKRSHTAAIAIAGVLSIALYFFHYKNLHSTDFTSLFQHLPYFAMFLGSFLGMPFSAAFAGSDTITLASLCGWIALAIAAVDLVRITYKKLYAEPVVIVLGGFCLLVLASATLTAAARMNPADPDMVTSRAGRYVTEPTLFWCALLLLSVWLLGRAGRDYAAFVFIAMAGMLSETTLAQSTEYYKWWENYFQRGQWAAIGLANGVTDRAVTDLVFPGPDYVARFKPVLVGNRLALFAGPEHGWIGRQADQTFSRGSDGSIHGEVTTVRRLGRDFEVQGWAEDGARVIFVDETGRIVGFGMRPGAGPAQLYSNDVPRSLAFAGFIRGEFGTHEFSLWAIDPQGSTMCRMGRLSNALPWK